MNRWVQLAVGVAATVAFSLLGGQLLWWNAQMVSFSLESRSWPTTTGVVVASALDTRGEPTPRIQYRYEVDGLQLASTRLGFDIFDKPGGRGTARSRVARYPVGAEVRVYHHPDAPSQAVLEPGDVSPFLMPTLFGVLFSGGGVLMGIKTLAYASGRKGGGLDRSQRIRIAAGATTVLFYVLMVLVSFDSGVQEVQRAALGDALPPGWSPTATWIGIQTALFLPIPWFVFHLTTLMIAGGTPTTQPLSVVLQAFRIRAGGGPLAGSATAILLGMAYVVAVVGAWIAFAACRGLQMTHALP